MGRGYSVTCWIVSRILPKSQYLSMACFFRHSFLCHFMLICYQELYLEYKRILTTKWLSHSRYLFFYDWQWQLDVNFYHLAFIICRVAVKSLDFYIKLENLGRTETGCWPLSTSDESKATAIAPCPFTFFWSSHSIHQNYSISSVNFLKSTRKNDNSLNHEWNNKTRYYCRIKYKKKMF